MLNSLVPLIINGCGAYVVMPIFIFISKCEPVEDFFHWRNFQLPVWRRCSSIIMANLRKFFFNYLMMMAALAQVNVLCYSKSCLVSVYFFFSMYLWLVAFVTHSYSRYFGYVLFPVATINSIGLLYTNSMIVFMVQVISILIGICILHSLFSTDRVTSHPRESISESDLPKLYQLIQNVKGEIIHIFSILMLHSMFAFVYNSRPWLSDFFMWRSARRPHSVMEFLSRSVQNVYHYRFNYLSILLMVFNMVAMREIGSNSVCILGLNLCFMVGNFSYFASVLLRNRRNYFRCLSLFLLIVIVITMYYCEILISRTCVVTFALCGVGIVLHSSMMPAVPLVSYSLPPPPLITPEEVEEVYREEEEEEEDAEGDSDFLNMKQLLSLTKHVDFLLKYLVVFFRGLPPWPEFFGLPFNRSFRQARQSIPGNLVHYRFNYFLIFLLVLALSLPSKEVMLQYFIALMVWILRHMLIVGGVQRGIAILNNWFLLPVCIVFTLLQIDVTNTLACVVFAIMISMTIILCHSGLKRNIVRPVDWRTIFNWDLIYARAIEEDTGSTV